MVPARSEENAEVKKELKISDIWCFPSWGCLLQKRVQSMYKEELYLHLFEYSRQLNLTKNVMRSESISTYVLEKLAFSIKLWRCRLNAEHIISHDKKTFLRLFSDCATVIFSDILQLEVKISLLLSSANL